MPTIANLKAYLQGNADKGVRAAQDLSARLLEDAVSAIIWCDGAITAIARGDVSAHYLRAIDAWEEARDAGTLSEKQPQTEDAAVQFIYDSVVRMALQEGRYPKRSTSINSNLMAQEKAAAYAYIAGEWDYM